VIGAAIFDDSRDLPQFLLATVAWRGRRLPPRILTSPLGNIEPGLLATFHAEDRDSKSALEADARGEGSRERAWVPARAAFELRGIAVWAGLPYSITIRPCPYA
jgi:hypothetical protein